MATFAYSLLLALLPAALLCCGQSPSMPHVLRGKTMGTEYDIRFFGDQDPQHVRSLVESWLLDFDAVFSTYRVDSEISIINAAATTEPVPASQKMLALLALGQEIAERTDGAFDMTVKPLRDRYDSVRRDGAPWPSDSEREEMLGRVGWQKVTLVEGAVRKETSDLQFDVNALAKGAGVDGVGALLLDAGITSFKVEIGGEVFCMGAKQDGGPWRIGIEHPEHPGSGDHAMAVVHLDGRALATSGTYQNRAERDGRAGHHIFDPRTGTNATHDLVSVAVEAPTCALADALATAFMVLGPDGIAAVVARYPEGTLRVFLVQRRPDGSLHSRWL